MYQVLVVDDEAWMCEAMAKIIHKVRPSFRVVSTADNGLHGLSAIRDRQVDVVFADICMPGLDGLDMVRQMREEGWSLPVVMISGHHEFDYAKTAIRYGVYDYLLKPVDRNEIAEVLERLERKLAEQSAVSVEICPEESFKETELRRGDQIVNMMREKARLRYMDDLSISVISDQTGFNPSYLSRIFKQESGKGYVQYVTEIRLQVARQLLISRQELQVSEIARQVGYWDDKHFSKQFKREIGMTPSEYRRSHAREEGLADWAE
ncbi:response regulator transcription factor [Paenibacillus piri]|uniref:Response regulator n=1 Tax=Paenibacillus piri TaxID=2547395 RepID=A0A4R5KUZ5_9BACL|nr:response regulator [Paenibacillus piri]TDF99773.1 response regulator [Paenibacillus piri]